MKEYILAKTADLDTVFNIVQNSIKSTYPKYYPKEVVDFFCNLQIFSSIFHSGIKNNSKSIKPFHFCHVSISKQSI